VGDKNFKLKPALTNMCKQVRSLASLMKMPTHISSIS
jgi:hypothetical protein